MQGQASPRPHEWCSDQPFPWPEARALHPGEPFTGCFCVVDVQQGRTKQDKPYLKLELVDSHGSIEGRMWDDVDSVIRWLDARAFVGVRGRIEEFNRSRQIKVENITPIEVTDDDLALFLPHSAREPADMERELTTWIRSLEDPALRRLIGNLLDPGSMVGSRFRTAPAAKHNHHAYIGGLLEHTLSVTTVCEKLAAHYRDGIDRDLLIAGALVHDIGKTIEIEPTIGFPYTDEGKLLGHIVIGLRLIGEAADRVPDLSAERRMLLEHLVASHQGRYEWQSPREPRTLEALLLHHADDLDAKLHQASRLVHGVSVGWSAYARSFGRDFFRHSSAEQDSRIESQKQVETRGSDDSGDEVPGRQRPAEGRTDRSGPVGPENAANGARGNGEGDPTQDSLDLFG